MAHPPLLIAAVTRPCAGETVSGDSWAIDYSDELCRVAVIDGLGHGPDAAHAAALARESLAAEPALSPSQALARCHQALHYSRGAAISIVTIDQGRNCLAFVGVGNVDVVVWRGRSQRLIAQRGIVGAAIPTLRPIEIELAPGWLLILHTDGVSARFELTSALIDDPGGVQAIAEALVERWGRTTDDATAVVVRDNRAAG